MSWIANHLPLVIPGALVVATVSTAVYGTLTPSSQLWGNLYSRAADAATKKVALTLDDGPTPGSTDRILDILKELDLRAVFFTVGANVKAHPALAKRIVDEGHIIGNHTFGHPYWGIYRGPNFWQREIEKANDEIVRATGKRPNLFRPPMGHKTWITSAAARKAGMTTVNWSRRGVDGIETTAAKIISRLSEIQGGDIVLLHDGVDPNSRRNPQPTVDALPAVILSIRERGLELVRLDELINVPAYQE